MPECCADRGCAPPTADTRAPHPLGKSDALLRSRSRRRRPSGDREPLESRDLPSQSCLASLAHARGLVEPPSLSRAISDRYFDVTPSENSFASAWPQERRKATY